MHYTDQLEDVWQDDRIDLVVVSTGVDSHFEYGMQALKHGKNVLIEKPMTRTYQEAKMLFDTAKRKGLFVQCYQNRRFDSDYLTTLKVIESGKLGEIYEVDMHFDYYRPEVRKMPRIPRLTIASFTDTAVIRSIRSSPIGESHSIFTMTFNAYAVRII